MNFDRKIFFSEIEMLEDDFKHWLVNNVGESKNLNSIHDLYYVFHDGNKHVLRFSRQNLPEELQKKIISAFDNSHLIKKQA